MFLHFLLAVSAQLNAGDPGFLPALLALALMLASFLTQNAARKVSSPNTPVFHLGNPGR
jgi:hypothetical protein